jgi:uncharacterized protein
MVIELVNSRLAELTALCQQFHVRRLELFGSATTHEFDAQRSDLDFLVEFDAVSPAKHADLYFELLEALQNLLGRHVDLVEIKAMRNPYFIRGVERTRTLLYAA